jgi:hypothetical protein
MLKREQDESQSVARLIAEIDSIDAWRNRTGRRILCLFLATFVFAVGLLIWTATQMRVDPPRTMIPPGPKVPAVLRRMP